MSYIMVGPTVTVGAPTKASDHNKQNIDLVGHDHDVTNSAGIAAIQSGLASAQPSSPVIGEVWVETDTNKAMLSTTAGAFINLITANATSSMTADWDFGGFGIQNVVFVESGATNPASTGVVRLGEAEAVMSRNNANDGDIQLLKLNGTTDLVELGPASGLVVDTAGNLGTGGVAPASNYEIDVDDQARVKTALVIPVGNNKWAT